MFTQRSFSFGTIQFSFLDITTYKLSEGNGLGSYSYISCNLVCGRVNHRDSALSIVTFSHATISCGFATVYYIYICSILGDCNSPRFTVHFYSEYNCVCCCVNYRASLSRVVAEVRYGTFVNNYQNFTMVHLYMLLNH